MESENGAGIVGYQDSRTETSDYHVGKNHVWRHVRVNGREVRAGAGTPPCGKITEGGEGQRRLIRVLAYVKIND